MEEFITYGIIFKKEKFNRIRNCGFLNKPEGGLWCSPVKCEYSWRRWCENEDFHTERLSTYTRFRLKEGSKIYEIRTLEDWDKLIKEMHCLAVIQQTDKGTYRIVHNGIR